MSWGEVIRGINQPGIPPTEFTPSPGEWQTSALWAVSAYNYGTGHTHRVEVGTPDDVALGGVAPRWFGEDNGTGVLYARVANAYGCPLAIARAVPLS